MAYVYRTPVRLLQRELTSRDLTEFLAWEELEGIQGPWREDLRAAIVASAIANADPRRRRHQLTKPADFMPEWDRGDLEGRRKPAGLLQARLFAYATVHNAHRARRGAGARPPGLPPAGASSSSSIS